MCFQKEQMPYAVEYKTIILPSIHGGVNPCSAACGGQRCLRAAACSDEPTTITQVVKAASKVHQDERAPQPAG